MAPPLAEVIGTPEALAANVDATWTRTTPSDRSEGVRWYRDAAEVADALGLGRRAGAGILAALSPRQSWEGNVKLARRAVADGHATGHLGGACRKVDAILAGADPADVLGRGLKTLAFFAAITDPGDCSPVVIDRHAFDIAVGHVTSDVERKVLDRVGAYDQVAAAYRTVAAARGILPGVLQATVWVAWRRWKSDRP